MKQKKRPGFIRVAALLLVLLLAVNLVVPCLAATDTDYPLLYWDDTKTFETGVLNYNYDQIPDYMLDSMILRALEFTGYDVQYLMEQKLLYHPDYIGANLEANQSSLREEPILSGIQYNGSGKWGGTTKTATTEKELAATVTGKVPDIPLHLENGMYCTSFVEYFYLAYLPNCEGVDVSAVKTMNSVAGSRFGDGTYTYPDLWTEMFEGKDGLISQGVAKHYEIELDSSKDQTEEYNAIWRKLTPGAIIRFGDESSPYVHYAIYAGTYNNLHYVIHVGNDRGPEIILAEAMSAEASSKKSWPIDFYDLQLEQQYGAIQVVKSDADDDTKLAGAYFTAANQYTGKEYVIGPTNDKGYAIRENLPLGTYAVYEAVAPYGYALDPTVHTVVLSEDTPLVTLYQEITNTKLRGSIKIVKNILPSSAATSGNLAGWQFNLYKNSPTYTTTIRDGVTYRVKVTDKNGNVVYSDTSTLTAVETEEPAIKITTQPQSTTVAAGSTAKFTVAAESTTGKTLTYQWYYRSPNSTSWTKSTTTSGQSASYSFGMYISYDARFIKCLISDGTNEVWTEEVRLYLPTTLGVNSNPSDATAIIGLDATFTATFFGSPTSFLWQYSADGGVTWTNCSANAPFNCANYTTATLTVTASDAISGYQFRCVATKGSATATTNAATLTAAPAYIFTTSPSQGALVEIGGTGNFFVGVAGADLTYQWQIWTAESGEWKDIEGANTGNTLSLTMTEEYSNSRVRLQITQGNEVIYSTPITFATPDTFCITTQPTATVSGADGEEVTLSVAAHGEDLVYQWEVSTDGGNTWTVADNPIGTYTTDTNGEILVTDLLLGGYYVQEIDTGRENWAYDLVPKLVTVTASNVDSPAVVNITNNKLIGNLAIQKETNTGDRKDGWTFHVLFNNNGEFVEIEGSPFTTDSTGYLLIENLLPGEYVVYEEDNGSEYWICDTTPQMVTVAVGQTTGPVTITNTVRGKLTVKKTTTDGSSAAGYTFNVYDPNGSLVTGSPFTTDSNGYIDVGYVLPGMYTVEEVLADDDAYEIVGNSRQTLEVKPETETVFSFVNAPKVGTLEIQKQTNTGSDLGGWKVNVYDPSGNLLAGSPFTTDDVDGKITISNLPIGVYTVVEVDDGKEMWVYDLEEKAVTVPHNGTATVTINNTQLGGGLISKDTTNGGTKAGWQFKVWTDSADYGVFTTDATGKIDLGLLYPGTYHVQEIGHVSMSAEELSYWTLDNQVKELVVVAGTTKTVSVINEWFGSGKVIKTTNGGLKEGWQFRVWTETAELGIYTTNANGEFVLGKLNPGTYYVQEIGHATMTADQLAFWRMDTEIKTVKVVAGETTSVKFVNALRAGEITVNKVDGSNDAALAGAKFLLEWLDNDVWTPVIYSDTIIPGGCSSVGLENGCLTSDENGKVSFYGLHPDYQYRLTEIDAPDGYILQAGTIFEGTLPVDTLSSEHTVYNHPNFVLPSTGVDNNFRWLEIFTLCLLAAFALAVGYALNTIRVTRGNKNRK